METLALEWSPHSAFTQHSQQLLTALQLQIQAVDQACDRLNHLLKPYSNETAKTISQSHEETGKALCIAKQKHQTTIGQVACLQSRLAMLRAEQKQLERQLVQKQRQHQVGLNEGALAREKNQEERPHFTQYDLEREKAVRSKQNLVYAETKLCHLQANQQQLAQQAKRKQDTILLLRQRLRQLKRKHQLPTPQHQSTQPDSLQPSS